MALMEMEKETEKKPAKKWNLDPSIRKKKSSKKLAMAKKKGLFKKKGENKKPSKKRFLS